MECLAHCSGGLKRALVEGGLGRGDVGESESAVWCLRSQFLDFYSSFTDSSVIFFGYISEYVC